MSELGHTRLPSSWAWVAIRDLGEIVSGGTPSTAEPLNWGGAINWISPSDLTGYKSKFISKGAKSITEAGLKNSSARLMPAGSVHFSSRAPIGYTVISSESLCTNQGFKSVAPAKGISNEYLFYYLKFIRHEANARATGTTFKELSGSAFAILPFPLAPTTEQRRIVAKVEELFSELDAGVANLKQARAQLAVYRQALLKHAFEGRLTAAWRTTHAAELKSADQILSGIRDQMPETSGSSNLNVSSNQCGWLNVSLADITKYSLIGLVRAADLQNHEGRGSCYIKMDRIDMSGHVDIDPKVFVDCSKAEMERYALRQGDILFNTRNSVELVGKTGLVRKTPATPTVFNNNLMRIRAVTSVLPAFLNYQMCAPDFRNAMEHVKKATTSVAAVYGKDLWPLRIVIPSVREQEQIVDELDCQLEAVESMEADIDLNLQKAESLQQAILKKAFAGELVPQDPGDEPAAALLARIRAEREAVAIRSTKNKTSPKLSLFKSSK